MLFGISQRCCFFIVLCFDRYFFLSANRFDISFDLFHIWRLSYRVDALFFARFVYDIDGFIR